MNTDFSYVAVVGVDGSEAARQALTWAIQEAAAQGGMVHAVTAWRSDQPGSGPGTGDRPESTPKQRACRMLEREVSAVECLAPVAGEVVEGRPAEVLRDASREADLLVLGGVEPGRDLPPALGDVATECTRTAYCPVVVVPLSNQPGITTPYARVPELARQMPARRGTDQPRARLPRITVLPG